VPSSWPTRSSRDTLLDDITVRLERFAAAHARNSAGVAGVAAGDEAEREARGGRRGAATRGGTFPLGITRLDRNGNVLFNDKAEARFANRRAEETVGLNYFREVAPCTAVKHFQARFLEQRILRRRRVDFRLFRFAARPAPERWQTTNRVIFCTAAALTPADAAISGVPSMRASRTLMCAYESNWTIPAPVATCLAIHFEKAFEKAVHVPRFSGARQATEHGRARPRRGGVELSRSQSWGSHPSRERHWEP
jgi:photoactive yellow protein